MASPNPVPPRAVVHALRGVLLTTSCSVIILAEERRRRLNIARAAINNAKKLHTARARRNSAALSESFGQQEAWSVEMGEEFSHSSSTNNPVRRRRRQSISELSRVTAQTLESLDSFETTLPAESRSSQPRQRRWDEWDAARKELSRMSTRTPFTHNDLFLRISSDRDASVNTLPSREPQSPHPDSSAIHESPNHADPKPTSAVVTETVLPSSTSLLHSLKNTAQKIVSSPPADLGQDANSEPRMGIKASSLGKEIENEAVAETDAATTLDALLVKLEAPDVDQTTASDLQTQSVQLLGELLKKSPSDSQSALSRGIILLQSTFAVRNYAQVPAILESLRPACNDICLLAVPLMDSLHQRHDAEGARQLLKHISNYQANGTVSNDKFRTSWVTQLLMHYWRRTKDFTVVKSVYGLLQEGDLLSDDAFPVATRYAIRRRIVLIALDAGDDMTAQDEMQHLKQLRPKAAETDVKLRGRFAVRDAQLGKWDKVWPQVEALSRSGKHEAQYQNVLSWLTRIYSRDHSPAEVDVLVRDLVNVYGMALNKPLAFLVMDRHGRSRDTEALVGWMQFCQDGGLETDQIFFNEVIEKCSKYWNLTRADVVHMLKGVQNFMPGLHDPLLATYCNNGALGELHKHLPGEVCTKDSYGTVSNLPSTRGDSLSIFERTSFRCMNTLALDNEWQRVYETFQEATERGMGCSARCLRLAVLANIRLEGPHSRTAADLISQEHLKGCDVSVAMVPLLVARLEAGDGVDDLLQETLSWGVHIHDSVYNKAARVLSQKGQQANTIKICELAAQQNGQGELAYNKFNFSSLVHSYTGQNRYGDLEALISSFTSRSEWWQGSKECKESVKLAMKAVALRATRCCGEDPAHEEALLHLEDALEHIKSLRATVRHERETLTKEVVGAFRPIEHTQTLEQENATTSHATLKGKKGITQEAKQQPPRLHLVDESGSHDEATLNYSKPSRNGEGLREQQQQQQQQQQQRPRRQRTPSPDVAREQEDAFMERQSLAAAFF